MKKVLSAILAGTMVLSLTACGGSEKPSEPEAATEAAAEAATEAEEAATGAAAETPDGATGTVTIKLAHNMDFVTIPDAIAAAADSLNAKYKAEGIDLQIEIEKDYQRIDWDEYMQNIIFATKNGEGPDLFSVSGNMPDHVRSGLVYDMSDIDTSKFVDGCFDSFTVDGKIYAMPFDVPVRALYYRKDVLKELGWSDDEIAAFPGMVADGSFTWEQFIELAKEAMDKGIVEWGMLHRPGKGNDFLDVLRMYGPAHYTEDGILRVSESAVKGYFQFMYDAANTLGITPQDTTQRVWTDLQCMVGDGRAFSYYGPVFASTYVAAEANLTPEQLVENLGFLVFPVSEGNPEPFAVAAPQAVSINGSTKYPEICMALLEELYAGDSTEALAVHGGTIFSLSSVKAANEMDEIKNNVILKDIGYMTEYVTTVPPLAGESVFRDELFKQIVLLELGQTTPEQAYEDFKVQVELNVDEDEVIFE